MDGAPPGNRSPRVGTFRDVREGPFVGSPSFFYYTSMRERTGVSVNGGFVSPTRAEGQTEPTTAKLLRRESYRGSAAITGATRAGPLSAPFSPPRG